MIKRHIALIALLLRLTNGLEASPNSPCAKKCIDDPINGNPAFQNASYTWGRDLPCLDSDYNTTLGKKFSDCNTCMQSSGWEDSGTGERDSGWFLFNNRGAADYCLFGRFAEESNDNVSTTEPYTQCFSACNSIYASSDHHVKSDPASYDYCDSDGNYTSEAQSCIKCLYNAKGLTVLGNVVATLTEMCNTKPGKDVNFDQDVYSTTHIKLTTSTSSSSSSSSSSPSSSSTPNSNSGISAGAIAGIVLGVLVVIAAVLAGILVLVGRSKKRPDNKTINTATDGSSLAGTPFASYQYTPVTEHQFQSPPQPMAMRPLSELATAGLPEAPPVEMGPTSPRQEPSELGPGTPVKR